MRFTERLDEIGARPSIGTVADSYDNALAETTNGLYKAECAYGCLERWCGPRSPPTNGLYKAECAYGPDTGGWDDVDQLELATLSWMHWFNEQRLHSHCGDIPPTEFESAFYADHQTTPTGAGKPNP